MHARGVISTVETNNLKPLNVGFSGKGLFYDAFPGLGGNDL